MPMCLSACCIAFLLNHDVPRQANHCIDRTFHHTW
jgi:hypothetical protein